MIVQKLDSELKMTKHTTRIRINEIINGLN